MVNLLKAALAANFFLGQLVVATTKEDVIKSFPEARKFGDSDFEVAYVDIETHEVIHEEVDGVSRRSSYGDPILALIRSKRPEKFCRSFCPDQCGPPRPYTTTVRSTTTVTSTETDYVCPRGCKTTVKSTVTAPQPVATVTKASTTTATIDSTVEADTVTIFTTVTDASTVTDVSTTTTTTTLPVGYTGNLAPRGLSGRGIEIPSYLKKYSRRHICDACAQIYPPPRRATQTVKKVVTSTKRVTATVTKPPAVTITKIKTFTPEPTTETLTTPTTVTTTVFETTTPFATRTITESTTVTTTDVETATATVCAGQQPVNGLAVNPPGHLESRPAQKSLDCCLACYNLPGCNAWAFLGVNFCFIAVEAPSSGPATPQCPAGKGDATLSGGPTQNGLFGGPGQCSASG